MTKSSILQLHSELCPFQHEMQIEVVHCCMQLYTYVFNIFANLRVVLCTVDVIDSRSVS